MNDKEKLYEKKMHEQATALKILFLGDNFCEYNKVQKVLITSGKHFYNLSQKRDSLGIKNVAIIRLESYCPFPTLNLREEIAKYPNVKGKS